MPPSPRRARAALPLATALLLGLTVAILPRTASAEGAAAGSGAGAAAGTAPEPSHHGSTTPSIGEALQPSSEEQKALGAWLRQRGIVFYGAWWCPACFKQKSLFGQEAGNRLPYVECDKEEAGRERCNAAQVRVYPTWTKGSDRREGVQTIEELKAWSGFPGASATSTAPR